MKNKDHILKIMSRLLLLWMKNPWARLSQLIENCYGHDECIYYIEDEEFITRLEEYYEIERGDNIENEN